MPAATKIDATEFAWRGFAQRIHGQRTFGPLDHRL